MKNTRWTIYIVLGILALTSVSDGFSQDWPQWRGPDRDGIITGFTAPDWPAELTRQWTVTVGTGDATPALVGEKLYAFTRQGENEVTLCLNAINGKEISNIY